MTHVVQVDAAKAAAGGVQSLARRLGSEIAKFGTVGAAAFVIDVGLFNVLRATILNDSPLTAKTISVLVATAFAFLANRHWTYRDRARTGYGRETILFFATNAAALLISWACLATSHYVLGLDSQLADNISGNIVAVGLGTLFRFWVYRTWVFPEHTPVATADDSEPALSVSGTLDPEPAGLRTLPASLSAPQGAGRPATAPVATRTSLGPAPAPAAAAAADAAGRSASGR